MLQRGPRVTLKITVVQKGKMRKKILEYNIFCSMSYILDVVLWISNQFIKINLQNAYYYCYFVIFSLSFIISIFAYQLETCFHKDLTKLLN